MSRLSWDAYYIRLAHVVAERADCRRSSVGCVIVDQDHRIVSTGYNGTVAGEPGCLAGACPRGLLSYADRPSTSDYADCIAIHAEANALLYARTSCKDATVYLTREPCSDCWKLLRGAGVGDVIYPTPVKAAA